jgi:hypothetical protein
MPLACPGRANLSLHFLLFKPVTTDSSEGVTVFIFHLNVFLFLFGIGGSMNGLTGPIFSILSFSGIIIYLFYFVI